MNPMNDSPILDNDAPYFPSVIALRAAHSELLKRENALLQSAPGLSSPQFLDEVENFIARGRATGALLYDDDERWDAQSLLNYWATVLYRAGRTAKQATLDEFDENLQPLLDDELCPYVGLNAFQESNNKIFFGRETLTKKMIGHLEKYRMLAVTGASGSGKSSIVLAGVLPALKNGALPGSDGWHYFERTVPGTDPLRNLALLIKPKRGSDASWVLEQVEGFKQNSKHLLSLLNDECGGTPALLFIDQFEELFSLSDDENVQRAFADNLAEVVNSTAVGHTIVLTMRSDFISRIAKLTKLQSLFEKSQEMVMPLSAGDLHKAIEGPAERAGLKFDQGLIDKLVSDILGYPAALPLLQFTLLKLWELRERNRVTWGAYRTLEGPLKALEISAEKFYKALPFEEKSTVRRILLRLMRPDIGEEMVSNRVLRSSLYNLEAKDRVQRVLDRLIEARLVRQTKGLTPEDTQVEVAHEALGRNWPRFLEWLDEEREEKRKLLRLSAAAKQWAAHGEDPGGLLGGSLLDEGLSYLKQGALESDLDRKFVEASHRAKLKTEEEKDAVRKREIEQVKALAESERLRAEEQAQRALVEQQRADEQHQRAEEKARVASRLRWAVAVLIVMFVGASALWAHSLQKYMEATQKYMKATAEIAEANKKRENATRFANEQREATRKYTETKLAEVEKKKNEAIASAEKENRQSLARANRELETVRVQRRQAEKERNDATIKRDLAIAEREEADKKLADAHTQLEDYKKRFEAAERRIREAETNAKLEEEKLEALEKTREAENLSNTTAVQATQEQKRDVLLRSLKLLLEARSIAEKFKETGNDRRLLARIDMRIGNVNVSLRNEGAAEEYYQKSLAIYEQLEDKKNMGRTLLKIGNTFYLEGNQLAAIKYYEKAVRYLQPEGDVPSLDAVVSFIWLGDAYLDLKQYEKALDSYNRALKIYQMSSNREGEANTLSYIGNVYKSQGNSQQALYHYSEALKIWGPNNIAARGRTLNDIGNVYAELGNSQEALASYKQAYAVWKNLNNTEKQIQVLSNLLRVDKTSNCSALVGDLQGTRRF